MNFLLEIGCFFGRVIIGILTLPFILFFKLKYWIYEKCPFCKKGVWFFQEREFFEITPDFGENAHKKCYTEKNALNYHKNWFNEIEKESCFRENRNK